MEEEARYLQLVYGVVVTPTRHPKDISQSAENITVITSEDLEMINAHTLTDALTNITGVQINILSGPGSITNGHIQGSELRHVLVMIDGIAVNNLSNNVADFGAIPIQNIERVEIIKGPASSSWGSSLGGIINIITKSPSDSQEITGTCSAFYGEKNSTDYRAEASATVFKYIGYYLFAGNIYSDGLTEDTSYDEDNFYSKLNWKIWDKGNLYFTLSYNEGYRGVTKIPLPQHNDLSLDNNFKYLFTTLNFNYSITQETDFQISYRWSEKNFESITYQKSTGWESNDITDDSLHGCSIDLTWNDEIHNLVLGYDFDRGKLESVHIIDGKQYLKKWAVFSNDTITLNKFSLTPGIRYDYTNTNDDYVSPSFGLTYKMNKKNLFRGYIARGFNIPPLSSTFVSESNLLPNPDLKIEKIWSIQAGIESSAIKYLWLKSTLFRHNIWDAVFLDSLSDPNGLPNGNKMFINKKRQIRQGIEMEIKTIPVYNTSLSAGYSFIEAKDKDTGKKLTDVPIETYDIGIKYSKDESFWVYLDGHYIAWNAGPLDNCLDRNFIWDINLMKRIHWDNKITIRTFFTMHNIFNGSHYLSDIYKNHGRWIETGLNFEF
ncbi:MAG: TonB-dependent receptor plug domain-containing protein [bacterium]